MYYVACFVIFAIQAPESKDGSSAAHLPSMKLEHLFPGERGSIWVHIVGTEMPGIAGGNHHLWILVGPELGPTSDVPRLRQEDYFFFLKKKKKSYPRFAKPAEAA